MQREYDIKYFVINGGGDIYATSDHGAELDFYMEHPTNVGEYIHKIKIKNKAFCVSSSFKRSWQNNGEMVNHFIYKNNIWASSYIVCDNIIQADMAATIACIVSSSYGKLVEYMQAFEAEYFVINENSQVFKSQNFPELLY